jgi:predicted permease
VVYGVLLRPLPYHQGDRLVVLHQEVPRTNAGDIPFSVHDIADYRGNNKTLDAVVEHHTMNFLLLGPDSAERVNTAVVSANFFDVLGVKPVHGRTFVADDEKHTADAVLILSYQYWKSRFGGDPAIIGKIFQMNNRPHTVIGVLPNIPQYPVENDVYMPTSQCPTRASQRFQDNRRARMMTSFGRLKPGVSLEQAQADLGTVGSQLLASYPDAYPQQYGYRMTVAALHQDLTKKARTTFLVLLGAAGFVLLIACANVANLLLARLLKVERELAVRTALGASKGRLIRQLLTESMLLSLAGGIAGLALAPAAMTLLVKFAERFTTRAAEVHMDAPVLIFTAVVSLATGILFGIAPAFSSSSNVAESIKQGAGRGTTNRGGQRLRSLLVVSQVAVSFVLLIGAGLMIRSFLKLEQVNPGFKPDHLLALRVSPNFTKYTQPAQFQTLADNILNKVKTVGGVESVAMASNFPFNPGAIAAGPNAATFEIEGKPVSKGEAAPLVSTMVVSAKYFETIRQPVLSGRDFTDHDDGKFPVAIINQTMQRHRWPNEDPVGRRVSFGPGQNNSPQVWLTIVGVVGDAKEYGLDRETRDELYTPLRQVGFGGNVILRTSAEPMSVLAGVRAALKDVDSQLAVDRVNTIEGFQQDSVAAPRVTATLLGLFAALAMVISASGIAAVMALSVSQRTSELGIRMALGASRQSIIAMVVRQGLTMALIGTVLGIAGSLGLTRLMEKLLFSTSPTDPVTFVLVSLIFVAVAVVACFIPARQVTSIDPLDALRQE